MPSSLSTTLATWAAGLRLDDLPGDILALTRQRILDIIGVALTSVGTAFGNSVQDGVSKLGAGTESTVLGYGARLPANLAALANGALAHEFEFDDTHNETAIHVSSPVVATALAVGERCRASGRDMLAAVAAGNEIVCRIGVVAPGPIRQASSAPLGATVTACRLMGLDAAATANALGIAGSMTSGSMESWSDGALGQIPASRLVRARRHCGIDARRGRRDGTGARARRPPRLLLSTCARCGLRVRL
ncbi:MAG: MmgE/PrpD family protein [Pseudomonadota bacterium]